VAADLSSENIGVVVRLAPAANGVWTVAVDGTAAPLTLPLVPLTLIVRARQERGTLRGTLQLDRNDVMAPFQTNVQIIVLLQAWLMVGEAASDNAPTDGE